MVLSEVSRDVAVNNSDDFRTSLTLLLEAKVGLHFPCAN